MAALKHSNILGGYHQLILLTVLFSYLCPFLLSPCAQQTPNFLCILSSLFLGGNANNAQGKGLASMDPTAVGLTDNSQTSPQPGIIPLADTKALTPDLHPTHGNRGNVSCFLEQVK